MRCNLKGALVFCPYLWPYAMKEFSSRGSHKGRKSDLGVIHITYHGGNIETDQHVLL